MTSKITKTVGGRYEINATGSILADLLHFCDRHAIDFDQCSTMAEIHHNEEVAEEAGEGFGEEEV